MNIPRKISRAIRICRNVTANLFEPPIVVLTYHRVAHQEHDPEQLAVSPEHFREQLGFLRSNFPILRFDEPWMYPERISFVLTFDDGYADNLTTALPILREFECPATFFVTAGAVGADREFPWDGGHSPQRCKFRTLREDELRELAADPLTTVGSHTGTHPRLSSLSAKEQQTEIIGGHRRLEEMLGRKLTVFSYPFGNYGDFNADSRRICQAAGFSRAAANFPGQYFRNGDPLAIPRHLVRNWNGKAFKERMFRFQYL